MARKSTTSNGHDRLEEALATLIQNQAAFVAQLAESRQEHDRSRREANDHVARIDAQSAEIIRVLNEHTRVLNEHTKILERMNETIRDKIGFKGSVTPP